MRGELSNQLANVVKDLLDDEEDINTYVCKFSTGVGRWVDTPWAGIRRKDAANSFEEGIYVDYAFNDDFKTLRFSILQGINNASPNRRMELFNKLNPLIEIPEGFNIEEENPDIHFFIKTYDLENLNEEEMKNDLKLVLDVYKDIIPKYKEITKNNENIIIDGRNIWKIATGEPDITEEAWKEFQEDGFVAIGNWFEDLGHDVDYRIFNSEDEILNKLNETSPNISENTKAPKMIWNFTNEIKVGDIVVASRGVSKCLGIGIITSDYIPPSEVNPNYKMRNIRKVDWIINEEIELKGKKFGQDTVHKLSASRWNELIATYCSNHQNIRYNLLKSLFDNFYRDYYEKENIQEEYERLSDEYYESYNEILQKKENGQEYTNEVWLNLISHDNCPYVPYNDSKTHFEQAGFGKNDLDEIAISVFDLVDDLIKSPKEDLTQQKLAIANFNAHEYEGFQDGILSPIFFLIEPYYYIINPRMVDSFNFLRYFIKNENSINKDLTGYIDNNLKLHDLVKSFGEIIPQLGDFVVFNAFSIWLNNKKLGGGYATGKALPLIFQEKNHAISTEEWKSVLKNDILDTAMIEILKIIYESDNHAATTGEISSKRASLGIKDEKSYNRLIVVNSKKVKEFLNDKPIFNEDGSEEYWSRFFNGEKVNGTFKFQIKEELVKALEIYNKGGGPMNYSSFYDYLKENGYYFNKETVENYLLSLKVKPFVILTGNSGTGKTKLSQLFANYSARKGKDIENHDSKNLDNPLDSRDDIGDNEDYSIDDKYVTFKVKSNKSSWKNKGWTLSKKFLKSIFPIEIFEEDFEGKIEDYPIIGNIDLTPQFYYSSNNKLVSHMKKLYYQDSEQIVELKIEKNCLKNIWNNEFEKLEDYVVFDVNANKSSWDNRGWKLPVQFIDYCPFDKSIQCKAIVDGIPVEGRFLFSIRFFYHRNDFVEQYLRNNMDKSVKLGIDISKFSFYETPSKNELTDDNISNISSNNSTQTSIVSELKIKNYRIIPVGANWTENRNIVGYYNVITDEYQSTPAYDLIKYANTDLDNSYFLILDEMNLSHVERYFADFLSAIESGEFIPLYGNDEDLEIPQNLFIIGTVNVDETTYMFSPKVLDRANTIEFDTYSAKDYMLGKFNSTPPSGDIKYLEDPLSGSEIREMDINQLKDLFKGINSEFWNTLSDEIFKFQNILKKSNFDFGFRVINEIIRFMYVAWVYEGKPKDWKNWNRYFDAQIKQKMLPKLHGSERAIGETLEDLFNACFLEDSGRTFYVETSYKYPQSAKKLKEMKEALNKQRYVSFIN